MITVFYLKSPVFIILLWNFMESSIHLTQSVCISMVSSYCRIPITILAFNQYHQIHSSYIIGSLYYLLSIIFISKSFMMNFNSVVITITYNRIFYRTYLFDIKPAFLISNSSLVALYSSASSCSFCACA